MKKTLIITFLLLILIMPSILAIEICPYNEVNCTGECGLYTDKNKDVLCDYSEITPKTVSITENELERNNSSKNYYFLPILIFTIILYFGTYFLAKNNKISIISHKKIWNMVLLISFIIMGILGLFLVLKIEYGFSGFEFINQLFWHVEAGILMTIIGIFHAIWHLKYYKSYIKVKPKENLEANSL